MKRPRLRVYPDWFFKVPSWTSKVRVAAITIPPFGIFFRRSWFCDAHIASRLRMLRHEMAHWKQYRELGLFRFAYYYATLSLKYGYKNNPMEIEAREAE